MKHLMVSLLLTFLLAVMAAAGYAAFAACHTATGLMEMGILALLARDAYFCSLAAGMMACVVAILAIFVVKMWHGKKLWFGVLFWTSVVSFLMSFFQAFAFAEPEKNGLEPGLAAALLVVGGVLLMLFSAMCICMALAEVFPPAPKKENEAVK